MFFDDQCLVCGAKSFSMSEVLWQALVDEWCLNAAEACYINRQQGYHCVSCGNSLRSQALAKAIMTFYQFNGILADFCTDAKTKGLKILEINEAGNLSKVLSNIPGHTLVCYPDADMLNLNFCEEEFDLVVHSDTLEHVASPVRALRECFRILKPGGACCYTVPVIVGRMTKSRVGLTPSYHGNSAETPLDYLVHTEFGADFWVEPAKAGFSDLRLTIVEYPAGIAMAAKK